MSSICSVITPSEYLRDLMAARSNGHLAATMSILNTNTSNSVSTITAATKAAATKAAKMYDDWQDNEEYSSSGTHIKYRNNTPHVFHKKVGKWVATTKEFEYLSDMSTWVTTNSTQSSGDRTDIYNKWKDLPRSQRICNPYSYFMNSSISNGHHIPSPARNSIIIKNFNNYIPEADLAFLFSYFGPIIDIYRPTHKKKEYIDNVQNITKKSFFIFIEFASSVDINNIINTFNSNTYYFHDTPICVEKAGAPSSPPLPSTPAANN
jgi:hypothetical protein